MYRCVYLWRGERHTDIVNHPYHVAIEWLRLMRAEGWQAWIEEVA